MKIANIYVLLTVILLLPKHIAAQQVFFSDNFESGQLGSEWKKEAGTEYGLIEVSPTQLLEGEYAVRMGKRTDGKMNLNRLDLTLDLSQHQHIFLEFSMYANLEQTHAEDGIFLSVDGHDFVKIVDFNFDLWPSRTRGSLPACNLSELARIHHLTLSENSVIRFQQYDANDFVGGPGFSSGIYLDEVKLSSRPPYYASLPFYEDFENRQLSKAMLVGHASLTDPNAQVSISGVAEIVPFDTTQGHVFRLGSRQDKCYHTNVLDLYLNLAGQEEVTLSLMIYDNQDETHEQDGIYFSNDGGRHFTKVYDFDPDQWKDQIFGQLPPINVSYLAEKYGLTLTEQCIIRFQQFDDDDFSGSRFSSDGLLIDNIRVQSAKKVFAMLPFTEDFEQETLASCWQWGHPALSDISGNVTPHGVVEVVSSPDRAGKSVRLGSMTDKTYTTNALDLYLNLAGQDRAELSFWIYDHYDETHAQDGLFFSADGGKQFVKVLDFDGDQWADEYFGKLVSLNIKALAAAKGLPLTSRFAIRFQQHDDDDFTGNRMSSDGIYLDNIEIKVPVIEYASIPFAEDFETRELGASWKINPAFSTAAAAHIKPEGYIGFADTLSHTGQQSLALGKLVDGTASTNALDLHLQLEHQQKLTLGFWLYDNYERKDTTDGIWLSQDGGKTFKKAADFHYNTIDTFQYYSLDLDHLISTLGMEYTNQFVIRFQQSGERKLTGIGNLKEGFFIDDITVNRGSLLLSTYIPESE